MLGLMALWLGGLGFGVDRDEQPSEKKVLESAVCLQSSKTYEIVHFLFTKIKLNYLILLSNWGPLFAKC